MLALKIALAAVLVVAAVGGFAAPLAELPSLPPLNVAEIAITRGDTWERALGRIGLDRETAAPILTRLRYAPDLKLLRPGERLQIARAYDGRLLGITYWPTLLERYELRPGGEGWSAVKVATPVETRVAAVAGRLNGSLFATMDRLGEGPLLTTKFVSIFESEFDFAADSLPGDRFRLLVEKRYTRGRFAGYGRILIAQYQSAGRRRLTGAAFETSEGKTAYYDTEGRAVEKMFLRAPLDFTRITSGYSHARRHPVLGGVRPHLAIDYAAPIGTPVRAVADGVVTYAGWDRWNGVTITLRHARGYETVYNHLSRVHVRQNDHVRQRQVIGLVGSTGLSTGPHLDYRVVKGRHFVNPLSEKFIPGQELPGSARPAFARRLRWLLERLDQEAPLRS